MQVSILSIRFANLCPAEAFSVLVTRSRHGMIVMAMAIGGYPCMVVRTRCLGLVHVSPVNFFALG